MTKEGIVNIIANTTPRLVYLSGKTCSGKTTFAKELESKGYARLALDKIIMKSVYKVFEIERSQAFIDAYRGDIENQHTKAFIEAARKEIEQKVKESPVVMEGAIASSDILRAVLANDLKDSFLFVYFQAIDLGEYARRITARFEDGIRDDDTGLPKSFWPLIAQADIEHYLEHGEINQNLKQAIEEFAKRSAQESRKRLEHFQQHFSDIAVIEF